MKTDPDAEAMIRDSDFYLIGIRPEVRFSEPDADTPGRVTFGVNTGDGLEDTVVLDVAALAANRMDESPEEITVEAGPKVVRLWAGSAEDVEAGRGELFEWFTTDKLIHDRSRGLDGVLGFDKVRDFATYELLYVGIAKVKDTFDRLFDGAHHARQAILSNEWPRRHGSRVTDEMVLFPLRAEPYVIRTMEIGDAPSSFDTAQWEELRRRVVADAEKAFVHLLDPQYNVVKFAGYPAGTDGLAASDYERRGFFLVENFTFRTETQTFYGSGNPELRLFRRLRRHALHRRQARRTSCRTDAYRCGRTGGRHALKGLGG